MNESEAIEIAKQVASERGWTWLEPISVRKSIFGQRWTVWTNAGCRGMNIRIVIDGKTRGVKDAAFLPR